MKKILIALITASVWLDVQTLPIWAQVRRLPTDAEIQRLTIDLSKASAPFKDRRTSDQKLQLSTFTQAWSQIDPAVANFLGRWEGWEEYIAIYSSNVKNRVCIVFGGSGADGSGDGGSYLDFRQGKISNDRIITDDNLVIIRQGNTLGTAQIVQTFETRQPVVSPYFFPRGLTHPTHLGTGQPATELFQLFEKFDRLGCTASLPEASSEQCTRWEQFKLPVGRGYPTPAFHSLPNGFKRGCVLSQESLFTNNPLQVAYVLKDGAKPDATISDGKIVKVRGVPNFKRESANYLDRLTEQGQALKITWLTPTTLGADSQVRSLPLDRSVTMEDGRVCFRTVCMRSGAVSDRDLMQILDSGRGLWQRQP
ncbi:hypothetical protein V2H45_03280 [Tumidithrix elongata RA019]|uniref:Uncharacterized protein n=1 Tax=Tumidithrix elongata BACA0141 TaxID=2716417 RepID=A0AAW9PTS0_9CYAN|nr:hypothetical protein [Tumidithrix elongata RA019]